MPTTRCREYREGRMGRRRTYRCRYPGCGKKFQEDRLGPLPEDERFCPDCRTEHPEIVLAIWQKYNCAGCYFADDEKVGTGEPCCTRVKGPDPLGAVCRARIKVNYGL